MERPMVYWAVVGLALGIGTWLIVSTLTGQLSEVAITAGAIIILAGVLMITWGIDAAIDGREAWISLVTLGAVSAMLLLYQHLTVERCGESSDPYNCIRLDDGYW